MNTEISHSERDTADPDTLSSRNNKAQAHSNIQRVKSAEPIENSMGKMYGTFLSSMTEEDLERIREYSKKLQADDKARKEFFIRVGLYNEDGSVAEPFRHLFEGSTCTPRT